MAALGWGVCSGVGKHRWFVKGALIAGCTALWAAGFSAPAIPRVPSETRGDLLFVALFASLALLFWPLRRRIREVEEGIGDIHRKVLRIKGPRAVADTESGAS